MQKLLPLESKSSSESWLVFVLSFGILIFSLNADELKLFQAAHQSCVPSSTLDGRIKESEEAHQAALKKERDELSRVKLELEQLRKEKADAETALAEEKRLRVETEQRATSVEQRLEELKAKPEEWRELLAQLNSKMSSKSLLLISFIPIPQPR